MKASQYGLFGICAVVVVLPGCTGLQSPIGAPGIMTQSAGIAKPASSYHVLYRFLGGRNGAHPAAPLINVKGTLYGTTTRSQKDDGTVFSVSTGGAQKVLYSFAGSPDGSGPEAGLKGLNGILYGTTAYGGGSGCSYKHFVGCGTVFSVTTAGVENVLYTFGGGSYDGVIPYAGLTGVAGTLYGTTSLGGNNFEGTVFSVTPSGAEQTLHSFGGGSDGAYPYGGLVNINGVLYGTTWVGGAHHAGVIFSITTSGAEKVVYSFGRGRSDAADPRAGLVNVKGTLYGTTYEGGNEGYGAVFSVTTTGREKVLHSFDYFDGKNPAATLVERQGVLYGTTLVGGANNAGTVFSVTTTGKETVLHSFGKGSDGYAPEAGLINFHGTLYGTTYDGGSGHHGTVFALTP